MEARTGGDLSQLRIDRDAPPKRRWVPAVALLAFVAILVAAVPRARVYLAERNAPEVEVALASQLVSAAGSAPAVPVLVATGYVVARHSSDVGVKVGGRLQTMDIEEGSRVRAGQVLARIEHADLDAQLSAAQLAVSEAEAQVGQWSAQRDEDRRNVDRQRALMRDGITTEAQLTGAEAALAVSEARIQAAQASIASARARVRVTQEALENTNVRAPFDGVVIKKRAEKGETVSPFGVQGESTREGGAIATIADLRELEVQTEVSESNVAKLARGMPADVRLQAYQDSAFVGRVREIFPSADRAKAIVEVRVTMVNADARVKPEMTATVTFQEPHAASASSAPTASIIVVPKGAIVDRPDGRAVWVVNGGRARTRPVVLGAERLDQVEVRSGVMPGETVILNPPAGLDVDGTAVRPKGSPR